MNRKRQKDESVNTLSVIPMSGGREESCKLPKIHAIFLKMEKQCR